MSRSNNNRGEAGHVPPPPPPASRQNPQHGQQPYWPQPEAHQQQGYIPPPLPQGQPQGYDQQGYYFPPQGGQQAAPGYDAYGQPLHQQGGAQPPSLSSYVPAAQNGHQHGQWQGEPQLTDPHAYDLGHYAAGQPYAPQAPQALQGHDRLPPDFGQYGAPPPPAQQGYYPAPPQQGYPPQHAGYDQAYADPYAQPGHAQPQMRAPAPPHAGGHPPHSNYDPHAQALSHDGHDQGEAEEDFDEEEYAEEEPRRGKRSLMVVAALVGAIGIGGGLAYGYKKFVGPTAGKQQIAEAKTSKAPPPAPERKIAERLPDVVPQSSPDPAPASSDNQDLGGPRKVQLIPITPTGVPGSVVASAPPAPQRATINVPGVTLENTGPPPPPVRIPAAVPPPPPVAAAVAPVQPVRPAPVARPAPAAPAAEAPEVAPKKVAKAPAVKTKSNDAFTPGGATASVAPAAKSGGNGYVAVLASQKSRMDALKVYADLQQKYGDVLSNKPADVQEANLGDKGVYYRAVVGPPGSREAATTLCTQLKTAGYTGCWVTAY